ncbi:MAG: helix-turn-helix transcriptional regulator [Bacteroidales bacterium]|nr:helix-turn-helix transcriptional regulator [Bacteroidales bacterium]
MPRSETVPLAKRDIRNLIGDCLDQRGLTYQDLARLLGTQYPRRGHEPQPLKIQTVYNMLSDASGPMTMSQLNKICTVLEYPIDDLLHNRPYAAPNSIEAMARKLDQAIRDIEQLKRDVTALRGQNEQLFT